MGTDLQSHCSTMLDYIKSRATLPDRTKEGFITLSTWLTRREKIVTGRKAMVSQWTSHKWWGRERKGSRAWWGLYLQRAFVFRNETKGFCCPLYVLCFVTLTGDPSPDSPYTIQDVYCWNALDKRVGDIWNYNVECSPCSACFSWVCGLPMRGKKTWQSHCPVE